MNPYIHPENQKRLWNTIHTIPAVANLPAHFKNEWFKNIVRVFYEKNPVINDKNTLLQVNRQTIQYMIANIKTQLEQQQYPQQPKIQDGNGLVSEYTRYDTDSKKNTEWYNEAFAQRQKEYEIMYAKPIAPETNFAIKLDDAPLNNMTELIEKYKQERERDMNILPDPVISTSSTTAPTPTTPTPISVATSVGPRTIASSARTRNPRLNVILEEDTCEEIDPIIVNIDSSMQLQIDELKTIVNQLRNEISELKLTLQVIAKTNNANTNNNEDT